MGLYLRCLHEGHLFLDHPLLAIMLIEVAQDAQHKVWMHQHVAVQHLSLYTGQHVPQHVQHAETQEGNVCINRKTTTDRHVHEGLLLTRQHPATLSCTAQGALRDLNLLLHCIMIMLCMWLE